MDNVHLRNITKLKCELGEPKVEPADDLTLLNLV